MRARPLLEFLILSLLAGPAAAALNGLYTCANGNPGAAFDYGDVGTFFDALETQGISGPVTLEMYDDGGAFAPNGSYVLGVRPNPQNPMLNLLAPVAGLSAANPLLIRAATNERPTISGGVVYGTGAGGALVFYALEYVTLDGLILENGPDNGITYQAGAGSWPPTQRWNFNILRCTIRGFGSRALWFLCNAFDYLNGVLIENNLIYDCVKAPGANGPALVQSSNSGIEWRIRHNTIVHVGIPFITQVLLITGPVVPIEVCDANIFYLDCPVEACCFWGDINPANILGSADYNIYRLGPNNYVHRSESTPPHATFPQWQAKGFDTHGIVADPQLVNTQPGFEDLHLKHTSPAIDFVPMAVVNLDNEGDIRPQGIRRDAGADEFVPPVIAVEASAVPVLHNGVYAAGNIPSGGIPRDFTIRNQGPGPLKLTLTPAVLLFPALNCAPGLSVQTQPPLIVIPSMGQTTFTLFIQAAAPGPMSFGVSIACNDPYRDPYIFTVTGTGLPPNTAARANTPGGSSFAGPQNGPFVYALDPGDTLAGATILLDDADSDFITVNGITPPATAPAGITSPAAPAPGHPLLLTWTGTADAANPPGDYTWLIQFQDAGLGTPMACDVTIRILDLAPAQTITGALGGDGSIGNPYQCGFNRGDDNAAGVDLCTVTDPNSGQMPFISQTNKAGTNPGTVNFAFTLVAGTLRVSPAAMLTVAEAGQHDYHVVIGDGTNLVDIHVTIFVNNPAFNFSTPSLLTAGETGAMYTANLGVTGAIGAVTFTLTTGTLPAGLAFDTGTGAITGTPTSAEAATFTIQAEDATGATATRAFQLTINDPATPAPNPPAGNGGSGCAVRQGSPLAAGSTGAACLIAALFAAARGRRNELQKQSPRSAQRAQRKAY